MLQSLIEEWTHIVRFRHDTGMSSLSLYPSLLSFVFPASALVGHNAPVKDNSATVAEDGLNWRIEDIVAFLLYEGSRPASASFQSSRIAQESRTEVYRVAELRTTKRVSPLATSNHLRTSDCIMSNHKGPYSIK